MLAAVAAIEEGPSPPVFTPTTTFQSSIARASVFCGEKMSEELQIDNPLVAADPSSSSTGPQLRVDADFSSKPLISNRNIARLEFSVSCWKQRTGVISNRHKIACLQIMFTSRLLRSGVFQ
jgi:hypothetical protein